MAPPVTILPFEYDPSLPELQKYAVSEQEFLRRHPEYKALCVGITVFNGEGKLLLIKRAEAEIAWPNFWEIPGGKVDEPDETILHGAVRELKEETGLDASRVVRKVGEFEFDDFGRTWLKVIFEIEVQNIDQTPVVLDPVEHQQHVFASEDEIVKDRVGEVALSYITPPNKMVKLDAFRLRREAVSGSSS